MTDSSARGRWSGWRDGIVAGETGSGRRGQQGVDQGETSEPGRLGTSQSYVGQRDRADHPGGEGRSDRRGIVRGDAGKPQLPWIVQSGQGSTGNPGRHDRQSAEGGCGRTGVALVGLGSADEARAVQ